MSEAKRQGHQEETGGALSEFARRVLEGERTADLFGVDDGFIHAVLHKAHQFYSSRNYDKAETLLRGATTLDNEQPYAHLLLGDVLLQKAAFEEATAVLERARELEPDNPHILAKLGEAYVRMGHADEAMSLLERAVEEFDEGSPYYKRATALFDVAKRRGHAEVLQT